MAGRGVVLRFGTQDAEKIAQAIESIKARATAAAAETAGANARVESSTGQVDRALAALQRRYDQLGTAERDLARLAAARAQAQASGTTEILSLDRAVAAATQRVDGLRQAQSGATREQAQYADAVARVDAVLRERQRVEQAEIDTLLRLAQANKAAADAERARVNSDAAQHAINARLGVSAPATGAARQSASVFEAAFAESDAAWENMGRGVSDAATAIDRLNQKYVPLLGVSRQYRQELTEINALARGGQITEEQRFAAVQRSTRAFQAQAAALDQHAVATKADAYAQQQLTFQLNDVVGGLLSGQPPLQILIQQGPQLSQAVGGWTKAFQLLMSPIALAVAGFAAVAGGITAVLVRGSQLEAEGRKIGGAIAAMGGASGLGTADVQGVIRRQTALPGFDRDTTAQAAQQLLGVRQIQGAQFQQTLEAARNFALLTGQELPSALQALSGALAGGAEGLKKLDDQYNFLTLDQVRLIESLDRQGKVQDVVSVGLTAMSARFRDGSSVLSDYQKATDEARKTTAEFFDAIANSTASKAALGFFGQLAKAQADFLKSLVPDADPIKALQDQLKARQASLVLLQSGGLEGAAAGAFDQFFGKNFDFERLFKGGAGESSADAAKRKIAELAAEINKLQGAKDAAAWMTQLDLIFKQQATDAQAAGKKVEELVKQYLPLREGAKQAADYMEALWQAIQKATDPARVAELSAALQGVTRAANDAARGVVGTAEFERADAEDLGRTSRNQRAVREAQQRALRTWLDMSPEAQAQTSLRDLTAAEVGKVSARIREEAKNLFEDLSAGNRQLLGMVESYGKGLAEAYREAARQAGIEAERTQAGVSADAVKIQKLIEQSLQGLQGLRAGNIDFGRQVEAQERLAAAEGKGVAGVRDATRANELAQFAADAYARAQANLADAVESGDQRRIASANAIIAKIDEEVKKRDDALKRQQEAARTIEAIQFNRQHDAGATYKAEIDKLNDLARTGLLSAKAIADAWEEAEIRKGRASTSFYDGAIAGLLEYGRQARNVGQGVADTLSQGFQSATDLAARSMLGMEVNAKAALQNLKLMLLKTFIGGTFSPVATFLGGILGGGAGIGGGGTQTIMLNGQPVTIQGGGGAGFNPFGGGMGMPGGGSMFGDFFSRPLWGGVNPLFGAGMAPFMGGGSLTSVGLGTAGAGAGGLGVGSGFGSLGSVFSGLMSVGSGAMTMFGGGANTMGKIGGGMQMAGGIMSMIPGPVGMIGMGLTVIGSILGMLGKKKPVAPQAVSNLIFADGGWTDSLAMSRGKGSLGTGTSKAAGAVGDVIDELTGLYGLGLGPGTPGGFLINSIGKKTGNLWQVGLGTYANPTGLPTGFQNGGSTVTAAYTDPQQAISALAAMIVKAGAAGGSLTGLTTTQQTALRSEKVLDIDAIKKALDFGPIYDDMARGAINVTAAEKAVRDLNTQFRSLKVEAQGYGLDVGIIAQRQQEGIDKLATDVNENSRRRLLGLTPEGQMQLALEDNDKALADEIKNAQYLATVSNVLVDINQLEKSYGEQRKKIIEQFTEAANSSLTELFKRLSYGDLSGKPATQALAGATATADALYAQALGGSLTARNDLTGAVNDLFVTQLAATGNNAVYETLRQLWIARIGELTTANSTTTAPASTDVNNIVSQQQAIMDQQARQMTAMMAQIQDLMRDINRLLGRL